MNPYNDYTFKTAKPMRTQYTRQQLDMFYNLTLFLAIMLGVLTFIGLLLYLGFDSLAQAESYNTYLQQYQ